MKIRDNADNPIETSVIQSTTTKIDTVPPEIISGSFKIFIDNIEKTSLTLNETNKKSGVVRIEAEVKDNAPNLSVKLNNIAASASNITVFGT